METLDSILESIPIFDSFGPGALIPVAFFAIVGILAQWSLYDKCGQPGIHCIIPIQNVITFLRIVGRPASHGLLVMIPPPVVLGALMFIENTTVAYAVAGVFGAVWVYFMIKVYVELEAAQTFVNPERSFLSNQDKLDEPTPRSVRLLLSSSRGLVHPSVLSRIVV